MVVKESICKTSAGRKDRRASLVFRGLWPFIAHFMALTVLHGSSKSYLFTFVVEVFSRSFSNLFLTLSNSCVFVCVHVCVGVHEPVCTHDGECPLVYMFLL